MLNKIFIKIISLLVTIIILSTPVLAAETQAAVPSDGQYQLHNAHFKPIDSSWIISQSDSRIKFTAAGCDLEGYIAADTLDNEKTAALKDYYNNSKLTELELFGKYIEYKKELFNSLLDQTRIDLLYSPQNSSAPEKNIVLMGTANETVFGMKAQSLIFNTLEADIRSTVEKTYVQLSIEVPEVKTIYTFSFGMQKGKLNDTIKNTIDDIIASFHIEGLEDQNTRLAILNDECVTQKANMGIYPGPGLNDVFYEMNNQSFGYSILLPESAVPFTSNIISGVLDYRSYRYNHNVSFSISAVKRQGTSTADKDIINTQTIPVPTHPESKLIGSSTFVITDSTDSAAGIYTRKYCTSNGDFNYELALTGFIPLDTSAVNDFDKVVASLSFQSPASDVPAEAAAKFLNTEEGYTLEYPASWRLEEPKGQDINNELYNIRIPDVSGSVSISFSEFTVQGVCKTEDIAKALSSNENTGIIRNYTPPYKDSTSNTLLFDTVTKNGITYVNKLMDYIDSNGSGRMCFTKNIISGNKVYSLFVTAADYACKEGFVLTPRIDSAINSLIDSFTFVKTPEYEVNIKTGETRCRKVVYLEKYLKGLVDKNLTVLSASGPDSSGVIAIEASAGKNSGFYYVKMDYSKKKAELLDKALNKDIISNCTDYLERILAVKPHLSYAEGQTPAAGTDKTGRFFKAFICADFDGYISYITLENRPDKKETSILSWTPSSTLLAAAEKLYSGSPYEVVNCAMEKNNPFVLNVYLCKKSDKTIKLEKRTIWFNPETNLPELQ